MKTHLILIMVLVLLTGFLSAQDNKASVQLTAAIYEEEVTGNLDKAVELYLDVLKNYPENRQVASKTLYHLGLVNEKMGQQKAGEYFTRLINTYPDQTEMVSLAKVKLTRLKSTTTETTLKAEQSFKLAASLFKQFKYESAVAEYEKVIKLAPKSQLAQEAQLWIGQCYFKEGKYDQALASFNTIIKEFPESTIIPITEMMISQVKQAIVKESKKSIVITLDDKTILDTITGIRYTRINSWAGKNDIIHSATSITDISPNRKFILCENTVVPFDQKDSFTLFDTLTPTFSSRLSPDGKQVAFFTKNGISVIPVNPETGQPTEPAQNILSIPFQDGFDLNWAPDGKDLIFSILEEEHKFSVWEFSFEDNNLKQVPTLYPSAFYNMIYSKNGLNFLYIQGSVINMKSVFGKSLTLLDSVSGNGKKFILSPDNQWIIYDKIGDKMGNKKFLFRMADKQQLELSTPEEVGDIILWADEGKKVFSYSRSFGEKDVIKVASIYGGPAFELGEEYGEWPMGWSPNSKAFITMKLETDKEGSLTIVNLSDQSSKKIDGIINTGFYPYFSPDCSKILVGSNLSGSGLSDLSIVPVSLKDSKVTGKPVTIFKGFIRYAKDDCSWSPDGKKIAVCANREVWICDAEGGTPMQLTKTLIETNFPSWSPDGNSISVYIRATNQLQILKSSDGEVIRTFEKVDNYDWIPDSKEITIAFMDGQLNTISLASGKSVKIANWKEITLSTGLSELKYSPDGKWIAINGYQNGPLHKTRTFLINVANGKATEFAINEGEEKKNITWSPDSKWISYSSYGTHKTRLESTLWEADLTDFMKKMKPGTEKGYTTDFDFKTLVIPADELPKGWFKIKIEPNNYKVGLDNTVFQHGQKSVFIESLINNFSGMGGILQPIAAEDYIGKKIKMTGYIKSENVSGWAGMWLRIDSKTENKPLVSDNMFNRPITGNTNWTKCEIILDVSEGSGKLVYGAMIVGAGKIWFDNVSFEIVDNPTSIKPVNPDFEE